MFSKKLVLSAFLFCITMQTYAGNIVVTGNQPMKITYRVAYKQKNHAPLYGSAQTIHLQKQVNIAVPLQNYARAGIEILAVNTHSLPASVHQFNKAKQCSFTVDPKRDHGILNLVLTQHEIKCSSEGGVFGN